VRKLFAFETMGLSKPTGERLLRMTRDDGTPLIPVTSFSDEKGTLGSKTIMVDLSAIEALLNEQYDRRLAALKDLKSA